MGYKTIMLCLNEIAALPRLLDAAVSVGSKFGAHVRGLYVIPAATVYGAESYTISPVVFDGNQTFFKDRQAKVRAQFEQAMKSNGLTYDFIELESEVPDITDTVVATARDCDLIIMAALRDDSDEPVETDMLERVAIAAGRPVLALPAKGTLNLNFDDVVVGWNGSRESSRAVFDALPLLIKAKRVSICTVGAGPDGEIPGSGLAENLSRHGINPEIQRLGAESRNTGETLLRCARDYGAGLIVIGCYGHSRFSEMIFGGTTRHVMQNIDRAVLLSH
ncbi:universal stress protein [Aestuariivirga litoralis]|uniref:universal stress protein n=1 Tax=Aestuariivirga litoralis TaxID=2650924 RepID=UPI0018C7BDCB|nr:universal stress protein [Aestuariivirga litoralis]MBG1230909.1 universal stress protein [Aestuariivirga litoralis]